MNISVSDYETGTLYILFDIGATRETVEEWVADNINSNNIEWFEFTNISCPLKP